MFDPTVRLRLEKRAASHYPGGRQQRGLFERRLRRLLLHVGRVAILPEDTLSAQIVAGGDAIEVWGEAPQSSATIERTSASLLRNDEMASVPFRILIPMG